MKKKKKYEKPRIEFHDLQLKEEIANTCWGGHGNSMTWFYDTKGPGYASFQISGGKCTLTKDTFSNVTYYDAKGNPGTITSDQYNELYTALKNSGGESGNPFKGEGKEFPTTPDPSWS